MDWSFDGTLFLSRKFMATGPMVEHINIFEVNSFVTLSLSTTLFIYTYRSRGQNPKQSPTHVCASGAWLRFEQF